MSQPALFHDLHALLRTDNPAHLGPECRPCTLSCGELDEKLTNAFARAKLTQAVEDIFRGLIYLWHDHLDPAHSIAQEIGNRDGSLLHAIMHRREPDYGNAKYWFRHAGSHPAFLSLAVKASDLLTRHADSDLVARLCPNKMWDPFAFVDAVEDALEGQFRSRILVLEQVQSLEFECFLENLVHRL